MSRPTKVARFTVEQIERSAISRAAYNPRQIDAGAAKKLKATLAKDGLVETLVWNRRTGNLVGGHQRLDAIDAIEGGTDYTLPVSVIDVDEKTERELNIRLNNPAIQGSFDLAKLEMMLRDMDTDPFAAGFDDVDLNLMFPEETVEQLMAQYGVATGAEDAPEAEARPAAIAGLPGAPPADALEETADEIAGMKARRAAHTAADREDIRADHMICVVFDDAEQASALLVALKLDQTQTFVDADRFLAALEDYYGVETVEEDEDEDAAEEAAADAVTPFPTEPLA